MRATEKPRCRCARAQNEYREIKQSKNKDLLEKLIVHGYNIREFSLGKIDFLKVLIEHGSDITQANNYSEEIKEDSVFEFTNQILDTTQEEVSKTDDKKESLFKDGEDAISWDDI